MDVLVENGDGWVRREAHTANDCLPLFLIESRGGENLTELFSVAVLNLGVSKLLGRRLWSISRKHILEAK